MSREQSRWLMGSFEARVSCPTARPMDDACAGSRANQATPVPRSRSQCLIDAVVSAPVMVASSVNPDHSANATHGSCSGDFHDHVLSQCVADRGGAGLARCDAPIPAADPVDDQAAVFLGCLLPREVTGVERMDLAVGEEVVEVLVVRPRHEVVVA